MVDLEALGYLVRDAREARRNPLANHHGADRVRGLPARAARARQVRHASGLRDKTKRRGLCSCERPTPALRKECRPQCTTSRNSTGPNLTDCKRRERSWRSPRGHAPSPHPRLLG